MPLAHAPRKDLYMVMDTKSTNDRKRRMSTFLKRYFMVADIAFAILFSLVFIVITFHWIEASDKQDVLIYLFLLLAASHVLFTALFWISTAHVTHDAYISPIYGVVRKSRHFPLIEKTFEQAKGANVILIMALVLAYMVVEKYPNIPIVYLIDAIIILACVAAARTLRSIWIMKKLLVIKHNVLTNPDILHKVVHPS